MVTEERGVEEVVYEWPPPSLSFRQQLLPPPGRVVQPPVLRVGIATLTETATVIRVQVSWFLV